MVNYAELDLTTLQDIAKELQLPPRDYTLEEVIRLRAGELQRPPLGGQMMEEEGELPIEAHIKFWKFYS